MKYGGRRNFLKVTLYAPVPRCVRLSDFSELCERGHNYTVLWMRYRCSNMRTGRRPFIGHVSSVTWHFWPYQAVAEVGRVIDYFKFATQRNDRSTEFRFKNSTSAFRKFYYIVPWNFAVDVNNFWKNKILENIGKLKNLSTFLCFG